MLTEKTRLFNVLANKKVDRPPCICPGGMMNMVTKDLINKLEVDFSKAHHDAEVMADLAQSVYDNGFFENYGVPFCMTIESEGFGAEVEFGSDIVEPHVTKYKIDSVTEYKELPSIDYSKGRYPVVLKAIEILKQRNTNVPIVGNITGPISTASSIMEPVDFYKELRKKNKSAHEFLEVVTDSLIEFAMLQIEAGADIIAISDPSGTGEILGPKYFDEFAVLYINKLVDAIRDKGIPVIVHICGQMKNVYGQVEKINSEALSFDAIVSMKEAKEKLSDHKIMGNLSTYALEFGDEEKIKSLTNQCLKQEVDIVSPACGLGMKSPLENIQAILKTVKGGVKSGKDQN
ncbi:MAG: uroporphyrinogen decarboxylase family protein [Bacillota bacterium]